MERLKYLKLKKVYTDPKSPGGYSGVQKLFDEVKKTFPSLTIKDVESFLEGESTYTLHKPKKIKFLRSRTIPSGFLTDVQIDLGDLQKLAKNNNGFRFFLLGVDVLSRRMFIAPSKGKSPKAMIPAFEKLFSQMPMLPTRLFCDRGNEFVAKEVRHFLSDLGVQLHTATNSKIKASFAERGIRTVKSRLYKYFTHKKTLIWVPMIESIVDAVNHCVCRTTGVRPVDVNFKNASALWKKLYDNKGRLVQKPRYPVGSMVRIAKEKGPFAKGYMPNFSDTIYRIIRVRQGKPCTYMLTNSEDGERLKGYFYEQELCRVKQR